MIVDLLQDLDLEQLVDRSRTDPVLIFKHSTRCSVSEHVYQEFAEFAEVAGGASNPVFAVVRVIENRRLSNAIAERFDVQHESPQALLIKEGRVVWHASHWSITTGSLNDALVQHAQSPHQRN
jgi:bacillithiol system protein YtxJ